MTIKDSYNPMSMLEDYFFNQTQKDEKPLKGWRRLFGQLTLYRNNK